MLESHRIRFASLLALPLLIACTSSSSKEGEPGECALEPGGQCNIELGEHAIEGAAHVADCASVSYGTNPPSSGTHYFTWGAFGVYEAPLPRGFWVHALEHGAVVFSYANKAGFEAEVAAAEALVNELEDPDCGGAVGGSPARVILTPDPELDTAWAASAWGHTLRASCFDSGAFRCFFEEHVGNGPEHVCSPGKDFRQGDGSLDLPAGCGE